MHAIVFKIYDKKSWDLSSFFSCFILYRKYGFHSYIYKKNVKNHKKISIAKQESIEQGIPGAFYRYMNDIVW